MYELAPKFRYGSKMRLRGAAGLGVIAAVALGFSLSGRGPHGPGRPGPEPIPMERRPGVYPRAASHEELRLAFDRGGGRKLRGDQALAG